jgi:hypothetical protein
MAAVPTTATSGPKRAWIFPLGRFRVFIVKPPVQTTRQRRSVMVARKPGSLSSAMMRSGPSDMQIARLRHDSLQAKAAGMAPPCIIRRR